MPSVGGRPGARAPKSGPAQNGYTLLPPLHFDHFSMVRKCTVVKKPDPCYIFNISIIFIWRIVSFFILQVSNLRVLMKLGTSFVFIHGDNHLQATTLKWVCTLREKECILQQMKSMALGGYVYPFSSLCGYSM